MTGARISDVLAIKVADWTADGLLLRQKKTGKLQLFRRTPILEQVIDQARRIPLSVPENSYPRVSKKEALFWVVMGGLLAAWWLA